MMKPKYFVLMLLTFLATSSYSQQKFADVGFGFSPDKKGELFAFNFSFNRTPAAESKPGPYLWTKIISTEKVISFKPSAEASLGNVKSSPNNVVFEGGLEYSNKYSSTWRLLAELAPAYTANKTVDTTLWYGNIGGRLLWLQYGGAKVPFFIAPGVNFHYGKRLEGGSSSFTRVVPSVLFTIEFFDQKLSLVNNIKCYFISGDHLIPDGSYPYISSELGYEINDNFKFLVKYVNGQEQPTYQRMYAITFGLAIYNK